LCSHNISPSATELLRDINPLGSVNIDEEVCGWGQLLVCPHGHYGQIMVFEGCPLINLKASPQAYNTTTNQCLEQQRLAVVVAAMAIATAAGKMATTAAGVVAKTTAATVRQQQQRQQGQQRQRR
jgi:hypothetical protein